MKFRLLTVLIVVPAWLMSAPATIGDEPRLEREKSEAPHPGPKAALRLTAVERLETERLKAAHEDRVRFGRERRPLVELGMFQEDYRAVMHVHAEDSDHTRGTRDEVLAAARKTGVRVVMFSDHRGPKPETWHGMREGVLFFAGSEDGNGVLRFPGFARKGEQPISQASPSGEGGELRFLSHVEERYDTTFDGFVGMEICNRHTDAKLDRSVEQLLTGMVGTPHERSTSPRTSPQNGEGDAAKSSTPIPGGEGKDRWKKFVENFRAFPDEVFAAGKGYHPEIFVSLGRGALRKHISRGVGNDAH